MCIRDSGYQAAYRMFRRASASLGANWSLHDLRHLAAYRMARDPAMPLGDVQWILGHAQLTTNRGRDRPNKNYRVRIGQTRYLVAAGR